MRAAGAVCVVYQVLLDDKLPELDPKSAAWLSSVAIPEVAAGVFTFSQARYSVLQPGGVIRPHCGGTNNRLRLHLALSAPDLVNDGGLAVIKARSLPAMSMCRTNGHQNSMIESGQRMSRLPLKCAFDL
jgi:hypothetical protein